MLEAVTISKAYGQTQAVQDASFTVEPGKIFGLIGPNGAGKSTLIRITMRVIRQDQGEIRYAGQEMTEADRHLIGYLPEERGLYPKVRVRDMLLYLTDLKGRPRKQAKARIDELLRAFGLQRWADRKIEDLSKGMAQKIQFIGAIAHDPEVMLFDEPFSGLDPVSTEELQALILDLAKQGRTILLSTHSMATAETLCERIFLIHRGREVVHDTVSAVKDRWGQSAVVVEFDGDGAFIAELPQVKRLSHAPRWVEAELADSATPDELLQALVGRIRIRRFEVTTPSLHDIFVQLVGQRNQEGEPS